MNALMLFNNASQRTQKKKILQEISYKNFRWELSLNVHNNISLQKFEWQTATYELILVHKEALKIIRSTVFKREVFLSVQFFQLLFLLQ